MHQAASDQRQEDIQLRTALETQLSQHREQVIFIFTEFFLALLSLKRISITRKN